MPQTLTDPITTAQMVYRPEDILINMVLSAILGLAIALVYRNTHKGLSYSQSFTLTVIFVAVIVAMVMMVIGNNLSRAFALVGALSIIRFRTVVKDTKDTAYVFWALAAGMAAGTGSYTLAVLGTVIIAALAYILHSSNFGALYKSEFILRFRFDRDTDSAAYLEVINKCAKSSNMLHIEPAGDGKTMQLTYDIVLKEDYTAESLTSQLTELKGLSEVILIASKNDVDY
jgi:uncharacterized membrane protein YhiD involved in acid resistance